MIGLKPDEMCRQIPHLFAKTRSKPLLTKPEYRVPKRFPGPGKTLQYRSRNYNPRRHMAKQIDTWSAPHMATLAKRPFVLIVRDGWGQNPHPEMDAYNAVKLAKHPVDDRLMR